MNIAFLSSSTGWGGLEQNLLRYATWMQEEQHRVRVFAGPNSPLCEAVVKSGIAWEPHPRQSRYFPWNAAWRLRKQLLNERSDFLWVRDPRDLSLAGLAVQGTPCQLIFQQGMQINRAKRMPWHVLRFRRVNHWVTPLKTLREEVLQNTPLRPHQLHHIPLALDAPWFAPGTNPADARSSFGLPDEAPIVGLFGRLNRLKGQRTLIQALAEAPQWHAFLIGANTTNEREDEKSNLLTWAKELGVSDRIHWLDSLPNLKTAYAACDVYAMCSDSETFGMVTLEAMACGVPVIGTDAGGTPELLGHGARGRLIPPHDPRALAEALKDWKNIPKASDEDLFPFHKQAVLKQWAKLIGGSPEPAS